MKATGKMEAAGQEELEQSQGIQTDAERKFPMSSLHPGFCLNLHDRRRNPLFESHDPSMMYDPVSGWYYSYATDSAITSPYRQGIPVRKSRDLVDFEFAGYALSGEAVAQGRDNGDYPPTPGFWAPFAEYTGGEYRMYYSATKAFGSYESRIYLATASSPEGPFENRGVVMDSWGTDPTHPNAIDPHIIDDAAGGKYLVYGSFFGGIYLKKLDPETGLSLSGDVREAGSCIACKPRESDIDGPEGAAVIRERESGYYYLFLSYGWLGDDYDIRVGRSRNVEGPYLDRSDRRLDGESLGDKIAGSYFFSAAKPYAASLMKSTDPEELTEVSCNEIAVETPRGRRVETVTYPDWEFAGFRGPGHGVPFYNPPEDAYYFVHHMRDGASVLLQEPRRPGDRASYRMHYMAVRRMYFADGWPVLSPEPFAGEAAWGKSVYHLPIDCGKIDTGHSPGDLSEKMSADGRDNGAFWEWILFSNTDNTMVRARHELSLSSVTAVFGECYDFENGGTCLALSGYTGDGRFLWGKLVKGRSVSGRQE